jgi:hypothetical protein
MTGKTERVEVITSVQRWGALVGGRKGGDREETYARGILVSLVARRHGIAPDQLFGTEIQEVVAGMPTYGDRWVRHQDSLCPKDANRYSTPNSGTKRSTGATRVRKP